jgi:DNA repair protein RecN (Recombination protein N)
LEEAEALLRPLKAPRAIPTRPEATSTASTVNAVEGQARVAEVARMLGGEKLSPATLAHAQEMLVT